MIGRLAVAAWTVLLLNLTPIFNAGSLVMTIDPLSIFLWLAAMLAIWRALHRRARIGIHWPLAGLCIGLCHHPTNLLLRAFVVAVEISTVRSDERIAFNVDWTPAAVCPGNCDKQDG